MQSVPVLSKKVLSSCGRATRRWPMYFPIRRSLPACFQRVQNRTIPFGLLVPLAELPHLRMRRFVLWPHRRGSQSWKHMEKFPESNKLYLQINSNVVFLLYTRVRQRRVTWLLLQRAGEFIRPQDKEDCRVLWDKYRSLGADFLNFFFSLIWLHELPTPWPDRDGCIADVYN